MNDISVDPPTNLKLRTAKWFTSANETKKTILEDSEGRVSCSSVIDQQTTDGLFSLGPGREDHYH